MRDRPIGMFDSGFGGLTVARAVIDLLPAERLVYVGDTGRYPYGPRPLDEVRRFALEIAHHLVDDHGVKLLVVACNTAAAAVPLAELERRFAVPAVGVIEPGVRSAAAVSRTGRVGVIGTVGTVASGAYQAAAARLAPELELTCAACPGFVEFVERGETASDQVHVLAERLLAPLREAKVDALLLGCTHYPFLARTISDVMGRDVVLVSSADETAFEVRSRLEAEGLAAAPAAGQAPPGTPALGDAALLPPLNDELGAAMRHMTAQLHPERKGGEVREPRHRWLSSGDVGVFRERGRRLLGPELDHAEAVPWA
ncbi:MAG TPA: glutamate racemase [Acidimicrobiales bacterium]|jgi:glutamate racemase|nr:glutamate racemase [Acidimicrobiales bacterium]